MSFNYIQRFERFTRSVPSQPPQIDWSHPLAANLVGAWVPGVCGGVNLVVGSVPNLKPQTGVQYSTLGEGPGWRASQTSAAFTALAPALILKPPLTLYWRGMRLGSTISSNCNYIAIDYNSAGAAPYVVMGLNQEGGSQRVYGAWNHAGTQTVMYGSAPTANVVSSAGVVFAANNVNVRLYQNGRVSGTPTAFGGADPNTTATSTLNCGSYTGYTARATNAVTYVMYMWKRPLSDAEMELLERFPYDLLIQPHFYPPGETATAAAAFRGSGGLNFTTIQKHFPSHHFVGAGGLIAANTQISVNNPALFAGAGGLDFLPIVRSVNNPALLAGTGSFKAPHKGNKSVAIERVTPRFDGRVLLLQTETGTRFSLGEAEVWPGLVWGAAYFEGLGSVVANATEAPGVKAYLAGVGTLVSEATHQPSAAGKFQGGGVLAVNAAPGRAARALLAGIGTFKSAATHRPEASARFAGDSTLRVRTIGPTQIYALLAGVGTLKSAATHRPTAAARFAGTGQVLGDSSVVQERFQGRARLAGAGTFKSAATHTPTAAAKFSGVSVLKVKYYTPPSERTIVSPRYDGPWLRVQLTALTGQRFSLGLAETLQENPGAYLRGRGLLRVDGLHGAFASARFSGSGALSAIAIPAVFRYQKHFRFRIDGDGVDAAPGWGADEDDGSFYPDVLPFRLRIKIQNLGPQIALPAELYFKKNSGSWTRVTTSSTGVKSYDASSSADETRIKVPQLTTD